MGDPPALRPETGGRATASPRVPGGGSSGAHGDRLPRPQRGTADPAGAARSVPRLVWLLVAVHLLLSGFYALAVPLLHGPDEHAHVDLVRARAAGARWSPLDALPLNQRTQAAMPLVGLTWLDWRAAVAPPWTPRAETNAVPRDARPTWEELAPDRPGSVLNHLTNHPPFYYAALAGIAGGVTDLLPQVQHWPWDRWTSGLRLLNAGLVAPLPLLTYLAGARLTGRRRIALSGAVITLAIPGLNHVAGSVNNDNLLNLATAMLLVALAFVATGDLRARTAVAVGLCAGLAMLSKGFAILSPLWIAGAYLLAGTRSGSKATAARRLGLALGISLATGGWWYLASLLRFGVLVPRTVGDPTLAGFVPDAGWWLGLFSRRITTKFWGYFGVEQVPLPGALVAAVTGVTLVGIAAAIVLRRRRGRLRRGDALLMLTPSATTAVVVAYGAWSGYARTGLPMGAQGRYLYLGLVGIAVVAAAGWQALVGDRGALLLAAALAVTVQAAGMVCVLWGYWAGSGPFAKLAAMLAWSPWPSPAVVVGLVLLVALLLVAAALVSFELGGTRAAEVRDADATPAWLARGAGVPRV